MVVQSFGQLARFDPKTTDTLAPPFQTVPYRAASLYQFGGQSIYGAMYETQPNVRTVIDFIARNIAQLGIHAYRRVSDTDRERLIDHQVIGWLTTPNPQITQYRLIEALMTAPAALPNSAE